MRAVLVFSGILLAQPGCFTEEPIRCPKGDRGCRCLEGLCEDGFGCSDEDYCLLDGCTPGELYCDCAADGSCEGGIECFDGAVCRPDEPVGVGTDSGTSGGQTQSTSTASSTSGDATEEGPADCTPGEACGPCRRCTDAGSCEVDVGMPCDGASVQCSDLLWGLEGGTCYRMAAAELEARCDAFGECEPPSPQDCPAERGEAHVSCEASCIDAPGACASRAPAETVSIGTMCVESGQTPDCMERCANRSGSSLRHHECRDGQCVNVSELNVECGAYSCEDFACNTSCTDQFDCSFFYYCDVMTKTCELG